MFVSVIENVAPLFAAVVATITQFLDQFISQLLKGI